MSENEIRRCGGCERIYETERAQTHAVERNGMGGLVQQDEYDTPRCPFCGTEIDSDRTEVATVEW